MSIDSTDFLTTTVFDAVVIGTGLGETVLAAALARAGKNVLHLDKHDFYGSTMSTHQLSKFKSFLTTVGEGGEGKQNGCEGESRILLDTKPSIGLSEPEVVVDIDSAKEYACGRTGAQLLRAVNIDNIPSLLYADGITVETLLQNGVDRYLEFLSVDSCKMVIKECSAICPIPNSRAALFRDNTLTLLEKRKVANFLMDVMRRDAQSSGTNIPNPERDTFLPSGSGAATASAAKNGGSAGSGTGDELEIDNAQPLEAFLASDKFKIVSPLAQEFIVYGIAMGTAPESVGAKDGMDRICQYAKSTGRFKGTTTPFIYPIYGSGEVPQAFSREAAVFSATYMLGKSAAAVIPPEPANKDDTARVVLDGGDVTIRAKWVAVGAECLCEKSEVLYQRCVVVTDKAIVKPLEQRAALEFLVVPPIKPSMSATHVIQFDSCSGVVPKGFYLIQFVMKGDSSVREHLRKIVESLIDITKKEEEEEKKNEEEAKEEEEKKNEEEVKEEEKKPEALWCSFYTQTLSLVPEGMKDIVGVSVLPEPSELIDYKNVFEASKNEFRRICTNDEEYLPKMPNPEDIIWSSEEQNTKSEDNNNDDENKSEENNNEENNNEEEK